MSFGNFTMHQPETVADACRLSLELGPRSAILAGGTELLVDLRSGRKQADHVISLGRIPELDRITLDDQGLHIGAMVTLSRIAEAPEVGEVFPPLAECINTMAGRQIRNRGTMGGNLSCGAPCSDTPVISCAAGARAVIVGPDGERTVMVHEFVLAPRVTILKPGEILREIIFARQPAATGAGFQRFTLRGGSALAVASVAAWVRLEEEIPAEARIVMGAVGPTPLFATKAAAEVTGKQPTPEVFSAAGRLAAAEAQPISDLRGSAGYRRDIVAVLTQRALDEAVRRAQGGSR